MNKKNEGFSQSKAPTQIIAFGIFSHARRAAIFVELLSQ